VIRSITGFHVDDEGDWVAEMSCFHNRHIRHQPPFREAAWVMEDEGRKARLGSPIECPLCDRAEFPEGLTLVGSAGPWDHESLPGGLLKAHRTPEGRWGLLTVTEGAVDFQFELETMAPPLTRHLEAGSQQPIPPGAPHHLIPTGAVRLALQFWARKA
jgi:tellurite methyltransferase